MFKKARLKLTAWYLVIIMAISLSFSAFIYKSVTFEFQRRLNVIERRLELRDRGFGPPPGQVGLFIEDINESRKRLFLILVYTNATILFLSALAGYFLAGKTLAPIEKTLNGQKRFVADASHELKTPLTALQTSIEVALRDKKLSLKDAKEVLKQGLDNVQSLNSLSNYLLGLSRFQKDNGLQKESLNIKDIIEEAIKNIVPIAKDKKIKLRVDSEDVVINANRESLEKLITILLDNAVKYTKEKGKVSITAKKENKYLIIKVKDTGIGISEKDLPRIFDRFYRADSSRSKEEVAGFGLGLSLAKEIIELYRGKISVDSTINKGSTFSVKLPVG